MAAIDYAKHDGLGLAKLVHHKEVKPIELVDAAIERIERHNPALNAIVWTMFERAREMAKKKLPDGPFKGVPFLLKDIMGHMEGVPNREGTRLTPNMPSPVTAELVHRYLAAGLIPLGKTNVPEFGLVPTTESKLYGPARNPWNVAHSTGGSSGGSGAAVASGMVPMAHANDGGGSIRIPASACGLVGLKPTRARNPMGPLVGDIMSGLGIDHIVCRSVRDSAAMLDVTAGPGLGDPYCAPAGPKSWLAEMRKAPGKLRIAVAMTRFDGSAFHPEVTAATKAAAKLCKDLGHRVEEASPPVQQEPMIGAFMALWTSGLAMQIDMIAAMTGTKPGPKNLEGLTIGLYEAGLKVTAAQYLGAVLHLQALARQVAAWHERYDAWLTPTLATPPIPIGTIDFDERDPMKGFGPIIDYVPFTALQNATGQPAINLPLHMTADGLPVGVQFVGRLGAEALLLQLARTIEKAEPWKHRHPSIWD
jgi:amidase